MAPRVDLQLEKMIDGALKRNDFQPLEDFLRNTSNEEIIPKFSKNFINKLDKLINRELDNNNIKHACIGLNCFVRFASPDSQSLGGMVHQGLVQKISIIHVFARKMWLQTGKLYNEALLNLAEDFLDALLAVYENSKEGKCQMMQTFLHHIGHLATEPQVHILIQKEAVQKLNTILAKIPVQLKKESKILSSEEVSAVTKKLANRVLESGDYDLQIGLMEALCRMTTRGQRQELALCWFKMEFVATAFTKIQDTEFETDCRKFLNLVNGIQGDKRRVYSYPCLEAFFGKHELLKPSDEKLEEFWVDFNLESQSISFYFSIPDQEAEDGQWDTVCIFVNEVQSYTVKEESSRKVLRLLLSEPLCLGGIESSELIIHFSSSLDILQTVARVYGTTKHNKFVRKNSGSVVKTTVQIILDDGSSQAAVPESQLSSTPSMEREALILNRSSSKEMPTHPGQNGKACNPSKQQTMLHPLQTMTPLKKKVSESCTIISNSSSRKMDMTPCSSVLPAATPSLRSKVKPPLKMVSSSEKKKNCIRDLMMTKISDSISVVNAQCHSRSEQESTTHGPLQDKAFRANSRPVAAVDKHMPVSEMVQDLNMETEEDTNSNIVPDSQPFGRTGGFILPVQTKVEPSRRQHSVSKVAPPGPKDLSYGLTAHCENPALLLQTLSQGQGRQETPSGDVQGGTGDMSDQQLHLELTQRLEDLLWEKKKKDPVRSIKTKGELKKAGQTDKIAPGVPWGTSEPQRTDTAQKPSIPKSTAPNSRARTSSTKCTTQKVKWARPSSAESTTQKKAKGTELTNNMMTFISSQYKSTATSAPLSLALQTPTAGNRSSLKRTFPLVSMEGGARKYSGCLKFSNQLDKNPPGDDVYSFQVDTSEKDESLKQTSVTDSSSFKDTRCLSRSVKGPPPVSKNTGQSKSKGLHVKKHLFSDTDTDNRTDVSWLRASAQRPKPKIVGYTRQRPHKPAPESAPDTTYASPDLASAPSKPLDEPTKLKPRQRKKRQAKGSVVPTAVSKSTGRPKRVSAMFKSYKEPSDLGSTSQSEDEDQPQCQDKIEKVDSRAAENTMKAPHHAEVKKPSPALKDKTDEHMESWKARFSSLSPSPPPIERMRSADKPVLLLRSSVSPLHSLPVSPLCISLFETAKPHQLQSRSVCSVLSPVEPLLSSTAQSKPRGESPLVCQATEKEMDGFGNSLSASFTKNSLVSMATHHQGILGLDNSLVAITRKLEEAPVRSPSQTKPVQLKKHLSGPCFSRKRPASPTSFGSSDEEQVNKHGRQRYTSKLKPRKLFGSRRGRMDEKKDCTSVRLSLTPLRRVESSFEEEDEEEENKENIVKNARVACDIAPERFTVLQGQNSSDTARGEQQSPNKLPSDVEVHSIVSSHMVSSSLEASEEYDMILTIPEITAQKDFGSAYHQLSSDTQRKLQKHLRRMELFSKQTLKKVQHHMCSIFDQIHEDRTQRLERISRALFDEIRNLEQDGTTLNNMEKELIVYWNKQSETFCSIQEKQTQRLQYLRTTFQTNVCDAAENEERIFISEMCLMKKDIKSIQDKLFQDMHEEELLSVRRALQSWFLPGAGL